MRKFSEGYRRDQTSLPVLPLVCHFGTCYSHRLCLTITCNRDVIYKAGSTWRIAVPPQADRAAITGNTHTEELGEVRTGGFWADRQTNRHAHRNTQRGSREGRARANCDVFNWTRVLNTCVPVRRFIRKSSSVAWKTKAASEPARGNESVPIQYIICCTILTYVQNWANTVSIQYS